MVFQIVDDLLDITSTDEQLGKPAGHDMVEGVYTLPVLRTLQAGGVGAAELLPLLGRPLDSAEREKALHIVRSKGGVESAMATAHEWVERCQQACDRLPSSAATTALSGAPQALLTNLAL
jgi:heptaprenyl diphosphate synthase